MKPSLLRPLSCLLTLAVSAPFATLAEEPAAPTPSQEMPRTGKSGPAEIDRHVVIYRQEGEYTPFPSLYLDDDDRLITQFTSRGSRNHINTVGQKHRRLRSTDGGATWESAPLSEPLPPLPGWINSTGEWIQIRDEGWVHESASRSKELEAAGHRIRKVNDDTIAYLTPNYEIRRSTDEGKTWSSETHRAPDYVASLYHHFPTNTTLKTSTGVMLRVLYGTAKGKTKHEVYVIRSEDDGKTWQFHRVLPEGPEQIGFGESAIIETADHRLLLMMRPDPEGYLWQSFSDDFGKTWSRPESTGIIGHPPHLVSLPDGRLLCSYGFRRRPLGIRAALSADNGKTWDAANEIILRSDGEHRPADIGYPTTRILKDGSLFTIYYITLKDNVTHVAGTKWRLPSPKKP